MLTRFANSFLGSAVGLAVGLILLNLLVSTAEASHPWLSSNHIWTMHSASLTDDYCVQLEAGVSKVTFEQAYSLIQRTLYLDNPQGSWDSLADRKIYFFPSTVLQCDQDAVGKARSEIEYRVIGSGCTLSGADPAGVYMSGDPLMLG